MAVRLGDLLVRSGALTDDQRQEILAAQESSPRPFGVLAETMFGISPAAVENAWAEQYASLARWINPCEEVVETDVLSLIDRRQAWQFRLLPVGFDRHDLVVCTTQQELPRAMRFVCWRIEYPCTFVLADTSALGRALELYYPIAGLSAAGLTA